MRKLVLFSLLVVAPLFQVGGARADEYKDVVNKYYDAMVNTANNQDIYCHKPRSHTTQRCEKDFQALYAKAAEALGFELKYTMSRQVGSERTRRYLAAAYNNSFDEMQRMMQNVRALYYPLPQQSSKSGQAPKR